LEEHYFTVGLLRSHTTILIVLHYKVSQKSKSALLKYQRKCINIEQF